MEVLPSSISEHLWNETSRFANTRRDVPASVEPRVFSFDALEFALDEVFVQRPLQTPEFIRLLHRGRLDLDESRVAAARCRYRREPAGCSAGAAVETIGVDSLR